MKIIKLTGRLAKEFGDEFKLDVQSPAEAVRALCAMIDGFEAALREGEYRVTILRDDNETSIDENELHLTFGNATGLKIEPVVGGGKQGLGKIILGIVLIGVAFWAAPSMLGMSAGAASAASITIGGVAATKIASLGAMMILQGASMLLTPTPKAPQTADQKESFMLDATGNLLEQGNPVPVVFGEAFVGSVVISAGITSDEMAIEDEEPVVEEVVADTPSDPVEWPGP